MKTTTIHTATTPQAKALVVFIYLAHYYQDKPIVYRERHSRHLRNRNPIGLHKIRLSWLAGKGSGSARQSISSLACRREYGQEDWHSRTVLTTISLSTIEALP